MENSNKQLVLDVYSKVFGQGNLAFADSVIADDYIQHNPMVKTGKTGVMEFLSMLKQMPKPENPVKPFMRLICDSNFVAVHSQVSFMGKENAVLDLYRIENGLLAEHWDAVQEITDSLPVVIGTVEIDKQEQTIQNKRIVEDFVNKVLIAKQHDKASELLANNVAQSDLMTGFDTFRLHRLIGEHNFVLTQAEITLREERYVRYDIYRLSDGLIVEHWAVTQLIPDKMAHTNGMI